MSCDFCNEVTNVPVPHRHIRGMESAAKHQSGSTTRWASCPRAVFSKEAAILPTEA